MRAKKGEGAATLEELAEQAAGLIAFTNADHADTRLGIFGRENLYAEVQRHFERDEEARNQRTIETARRLRLGHRMLTMRPGEKIPLAM